MPCQAALHNQIHLAPVIAVFVPFLIRCRVLPSPPHRPLPSSLPYSSPCQPSLSTRHTGRIRGISSSCRRSPTPYSLIHTPAVISQIAALFPKKDPKNALQGFIILGK